LLVDEELLRAIRTESSLALQHWFGVSKYTISRWRNAFGVTQWGTDGSQRLHKSLSESGAEKMRGAKLSESLVKRRIAIRKEKGTWRQPDRWGERRWTQEQLDLLGTAPDAELAASFGRTIIAVRVMRNRLGTRDPAVNQAPEITPLS
jgi:hypothetical protein